MFILAAMLAACGKIKTLPTSVLEKADGGPDCVDSEALTPVYSGCFSFENGGLDNLSNTGSGGAGFTAIANSTEHVYKGSHSLKVTCNFTGTNDLATGKAAIARTFGPSTSVDMSGRTITVYVWVPANMFASNLPYGAILFVQDNNWTWFQSPWVNLTLPGGSAAGVWTKFTAYIDAMVDTSSVVIPAASKQHIYKWGIQIGKGGDNVTGSSDYNGALYVDSISIE